MQLFEFSPQNIPAPADQDRVETGWERFFEAAQKQAEDHPEVLDFVQSLKSDAAGAKLAAAVFGNSPFLSACWLNDPLFTKDLLEKGPFACRDQVLAATREQSRELDEAGLKRHLRIQKRRIALSAALGDITNTWGLFDVTGALSDFADAATSAASTHLLKTLENRGKIKLKNPQNPEVGSGLVILGMGKLGGRELNYSSDIDLIVLYDPDIVETDDPFSLGQSFVRLAKGLVSLLDERTDEGYVFRTDLRLRPDPGSTPLAMSTHAAEVYYESIGQNWERAAMIKARPIAGDIEAGEAFLAHLKPFVWRKNLDFAAIQDIQSIKRQINAHKGGTDIKLKGHNVKLGRGGIREIEFYAQTQQLIWGGRERNLRVIPTLEALDALVEAGHEQKRNTDVLAKAYHYLRRVEHRLQMVADEQTHSLPEDEDSLTAIAIFLGYDSLESFADELLQTLHQVEKLYADLFAEGDQLSASGADGGNLVFTGGESDPETLKTLRDMGFKNAEALDNAIRGWHHARYRCTRSERSRAILTELMPLILSTMADTAEPDQAFLRFDKFLSQLPAGVQLFSMFQSNPQMLELIAEILGTAPRLAEHLAQKANILDGVLTPGFLEEPPSSEEMREDLTHLLEDASCMEEVLDLARRWTKDRKFQVGVQVLKGTITERESQRALTGVAETILNTLQPLVEEEFAIRHGRVKGGAMSVVAFGKLGSGEKTPTSDMDMTFIYTFDEGETTSDGDKPLAVSQYFARLSQRLINALSAQTAEGMLYEVDMRLRPSGNAGPIATSLAAFKQYQKTDAWTWEHMALTRARALTGPKTLRDEIEAEINKVLTSQRDTDKLVVDVSDMRTRMDKDRHTDIPWEIKNYRGGLVDIEFISQYLQLKYGAEHPDVLHPTTRIALKNLRDAGLLDTTTANKLVQTLDIWHALQGLLRLTVTAASRATSNYEMPRSLQEQVCRIIGSENCGQAGTFIKSTANWVHGTFQVLIDQPAEPLREHVKSDLKRATGK
ncbi:bifunctional [glutamine synthetase] adenylyltransferase/[glutamine synthetase]-adenylyl-L-tyrosine phosphorylase [Magnetovibrio sp. PR-2]|uniref:bifunctional [glutamine synthetase] adenylyltransferase/[glutamine synthetase]-adenylyl-L-tyrosine phosphorylase n=1 Tax=Magnetovibrio sp. PR-2 TaxID=3120356 RepID=UPI002FCE5F25